MRTRINRIALAVACACAAPAHADVIDVNALVVDQLRKSGKLAEIYRKKTGQNLPADLNASAVFEGEIGGRGVIFSVPSAIPERPLLLGTTPINNCNSREASFKAGVKKETANSTTIANSDTVQTGREISITVGYESPFGASASSTATASQSFSATTSKEQTQSDKLEWQDELMVTVDPGKRVKVQFVVTEQRLERVPYTANLVLTGYASINFLRGQEGFQWVRRAGNALPPNVIYPGYQQDGMRLGVCRVTRGDRTLIGKVHGNTCYYGLPGMIAAPVAGGGIRVGTNTNEFDVLVGAESSVRLGDEYVQDAYLTDDPSRSKVCFAQTDEKWSMPGYVQGTECISEWGNRGKTSPKYKVLRVPATGGVTERVRLDDYLSPTQRTFNLRGVYTGVNAVSGEFRIGEAIDAVNCKQADTVTAAASRTTGASASAMGPGGASRQPSVQPVALTAAAPNEPVLPKGASAKKTRPVRTR